METPNLLYLDNRLAQASYSMPIAEHRLLAILLSKTKPVYFARKVTSKEIAELPHEEVLKLSALADKGIIAKTVQVEDLDNLLDAETLHSISVAEYASFCGITTWNARVELKEAALNLFRREIKLDNTSGKKIRYLHWVSMIEFDNEQDLVTLRWSIDILPYITNLRSFFTKLKLSNLLELDSIHSWRLYTLLCSKRGENIYKAMVEVSLKELHFALDLADTYKEFRYLNNLLLKKVLKEFQSKLKMEKLEMILVKNGRKVVGLKFKGFTTANL